MNTGFWIWKKFCNVQVMEKETTHTLNRLSWNASSSKVMPITQNIASLPFTTFFIFLAYIVLYALRGPVGERGNQEACRLLYILKLLKYTDSWKSVVFCLHCVASMNRWRHRGSQGELHKEHVSSQIPRSSTAFAITACYNAHTVHTFIPTFHHPIRWWWSST